MESQGVSGGRGIQPTWCVCVHWWRVGRRVGVGVVVVPIILDRCEKNGLSASLKLVFHQAP